MADVFKFTEDQRTALNIVPSIQSMKTRKLKCDPDIHIGFNLWRMYLNLLKTSGPR